MQHAEEIRQGFGLGLLGQLALQQGQRFRRLVLAKIIHEPVQPLSGGHFASLRAPQANDQQLKHAVAPLPVLVPEAPSGPARLASGYLRPRDHNQAVSVPVACPIRRSPAEPICGIAAPPGNRKGRSARLRRRCRPVRDANPLRNSAPLSDVS